MGNIYDYLVGALAAICYFGINRLLVRKIGSDSKRAIISFAITAAVFIIFKLCLRKFA